MSQDESAISRRTVLRRTAIAAGGIAVGSATFTGGVAADSHTDGEPCLRACWVDVKPNSCPNSVNPNSKGVLPVTAGWPNFDWHTVELVPVSTDYEPAFDDCQDWSDPTYSTDGDDLELLHQLAENADRSASPTWWTSEDVDGDGDGDSKFKFAVEDLELTPEDTHLVLRGVDRYNGCWYYGIDSVRVLDGGSNGENGGNGQNGNNGK